MFRLEDHLAVYTLHGHCGPLTAVFIDKEDTLIACSGSQDGLMCTWDLLTGACVYSIQAHDGAVVNLSYSSNYIISMGTDNWLCVWERLQGHLINSISLVSKRLLPSNCCLCHCYKTLHTHFQIGGPYCPDLVMLTQNLLVTAKQNCLVLWDVRLADPVKIVRVGSPESPHGVKIMCHLDDGIACSYGNKLRLVHFPHFTDKSD